MSELSIKAFLIESKEIHIENKNFDCKSKTFEFGTKTLFLYTFANTLIIQIEILVLFDTKKIF